jgi:hypothetical protein
MAQEITSVRMLKLNIAVLYFFQLMAKQLILELLAQQNGNADNQYLTPIKVTSST